MTDFSRGVFTPPLVSVEVDGNVFENFPVSIKAHRVERYAGAAPGSALISYPAEYAKDATPELFQEVRIKAGSDVIFHGYTIEPPYTVTADEDQVEMVCIDDKHLLQAEIIGRVGVGTIGTPAGAEGFQDVGFNIVFNASGKPNKKSGQYDFDAGSSGTYWTLKDIMVFLFAHYAPSAITVTAADLTGGYARIPTHLDLTGQTLAQAIDTVAELAGESWTLTPTSSGGTFARVRPGAGTQRTAYLFDFEATHEMDEVTETHASECRVGKRIVDSRDVYQAISGPIAKEMVHSSTGTPNTLLKRLSTFTDKKFAAMYYVDVAQYTTVGLGKNLSAGAVPKPWLPHLLTRKNAAGSGYLTAADIAADSTLLNNDPVAIPVWISLDGTKANAKLVTGGFSIDLDRGRIYFEGTLELANDTAGGDPVERKISDWSTVGVWVTLATLLEVPESVETDAGDQYLATHFYQVIRKNDLQPEQRHNTYLPNLASTPHAISEPAGTAEDYVDVSTYLQSAIDSAIAANPEEETTIDLVLPFFPIWEVGDRVRIQGREVPTTGNEVITQVVYELHENFTTRISATNSARAVDPEDFIKV